MQGLTVLRFEEVIDWQLVHRVFHGQSVESKH